MLTSLSLSLPRSPMCVAPESGLCFLVKNQYRVAHPDFVARPQQMRYAIFLAVNDRLVRRTLVLEQIRALLRIVLHDGMPALDQIVVDLDVITC